MSLKDFHTHRPFPRILCNLWIALAALFTGGVLGASRMNERISLFLARSLEDLGYAGATTSMLSFLSTLECGVNYGSEIARSLGISRQMVAKTVKELVRLGYLEQLEAQGKKKPILFTEKGEYLMSDARALLVELDQRLHEALGPGALEDLVTTLETVQEKCPSRSDGSNDEFEDFPIRLTQRKA